MQNNLARRGASTVLKNRRRSVLGRAAVETLEERQMLSLVSITTGFPLIAYDVTGHVSYNPTSDAFVITGRATTFATSRSNVQTINTNVDNLNINIRVDNNGNLIGGVAGADSVITGSIPGGPSGTLLTAEVEQFGYQAGNDPDFNFQFFPTGGLLYSDYAGKDIGMTVANEQIAGVSDPFVGSFTTPFDQVAKGNIGTTAPTGTTAELGDYVWSDDNENGIQDSNEAGVDGVTVELLYANGNPVLDSSGQPITEVTYNNGLTDGFYTFVNLTPGTGYEVKFDAPAGYSITQQYAPGSTTANDSNANPATGITDTVTLAAGQYDNTIDAGIYVPIIHNFPPLNLTTQQQPASVTVGQSIADVAMLSGGNSPSGTITFNLYNNPTASGAALFTDTENLSGGTATSASYTTAAAGTDYWVATYNGDNNNAVVLSSTAAEPVTVNQANPAINTTQQPATPLVGSSIADQATVTGYHPTGTVTFNLYNNPNGTGTPLFTDTENLSNGVATSAGFPTTGVGTDYWVAAYGGDSNNAPVTSTTSAEPVNVIQANSSTSTTIFDSSGSAPMGALGEQVYDTTTVNGSPIVPTGTVTYYFYNTSSPTLGTTTPVSVQSVTLADGSAPISNVTAALPAGQYSYIAVYSGDANYQGSTGAIEPLTINSASSSTGTAIFDSTGGAVTSALGEQVYDTATIVGTPNITPTGTVTYYFYNTASPVYGTTTPLSTQPVTLSGGVAPVSATTAALAAGSDAYIAVYGGDANYAGSVGAVEPLTILQASSTISTTIDDSTGSAATGALGEKVFDTAQVSSTAFAPGGTVTYYFYNTASPTLGTTTPISTQTVTLAGGLVPNSATTAALAAGGDAYIAVYSGDSNYLGSTGSIEPLAINKGVAGLSTTIKDSTGGAITQSVGEKVFDTATISGATGITPTGTVTYYFYNTASPTYGTTTPISTQTVTISNGAIPNSATTAALAAGGDSYIAVYNGDGNYPIAVGSPETLTIGKHVATIATTIKDANSCTSTLTGALGEKVYDTATITGVSGFTATGTVTYYFYNTASPIFGTTTPTSTQTVTLSGGAVPSSATTAALAAGGVAYIAVYSGDSNYSSQIGAVEPLTINKGSSSINTCIIDSTGCSVNDEVGEKVYDTAKVAAGPFTATGTVTYYFYNTSSPVYGKTTPVSSQTVTLSGGAVPNSATTAALAAGYYGYIAVYSGDANYAGSIGSIEPLHIATNSICGHVCKDYNGCGYNCNEGGMSGCTVQLWQNGTCIQSCTTASDGSYCFSNLGAGCYTVKEVCGKGYTETCGSNGFTCTATAGQCFNTCNFSNFQNSCISGYDYKCSYGHSGQSSFGGCTVQLWENGQCIATTTTGSDGSYCFSNVGPGCYSVKQVGYGGYSLGSGSNGYTWNVCGGQNYSGCNFSNWH